jgi:transposase
MSRSLQIDSPFRGWAMTKACYGELRERVVEAVEMGASWRETAKPFDVSFSSMVNWLQRRRDSGSAAAKPRRGTICRLEKFATQILAVIAERPAPILVEAVALSREQRIRIRRSSLWRFHSRREVALKETLRPEGAAARGRWIREQGMGDPGRLV